MTEIIRVNNYLRFVLLADALTCLGCGLLLTSGGKLLEEFLGLPADLLFYAGFSLFPFAAFLTYAATRRSISKTVVWLIVAVNLVWTADSFLLLLSGYTAPTTVGYIFVIVQAIGVAIFAELEFLGMRRAAVVALANANETV